VKHGPTRKVTKFLMLRMAMVLHSVLAGSDDDPALSRRWSRWKPCREEGV
jgi:hypothetical protein